MLVDEARTRERFHAPSKENRIRVRVMFIAKRREARRDRMSRSTVSRTKAAHVYGQSAINARPIRVHPVPPAVYCYWKRFRKSPFLRKGICRITLLFPLSRCSPLDATIPATDRYFVTVRTFKRSTRKYHSVAPYFSYSCQRRYRFLPLDSVK